MKKRQKRIAIVGILTVIGQNFIYAPHTQAEIPAEYKPNYKFSAEWDKIEETMYKIDAKRKNGQAVETFWFTDLLKNYNVVFNYLPQTPEYKGVYESCRVGAQSLSVAYDISNMSNFSNNCVSPLNVIFKDIQNSYTVKAKISANPTQGSAPLTVTFDGRGSSDTASKTTIPSDNYFWYYTDTNGVEQSIGRGPVVKQIFKTEGNYVVHLTVRSANAGSQGIFDGSADININVGPQAAKLVVFTNGRKLQDEIPIKFTSQEALDGLRVDGSATSPLGGRQIMKHEWKVTNSSNEILYRYGGNGSPTSFKIKLLSNGVYSVSLQILDNENNTVENKYDIIVADPIATIKVSPTDGNTSSVYSFDASTSYSVQSTLKTYAWTITDINGNEIMNQQGKSFQHKFIKPGTYRVRLRVVDELGNDNEEAVTLQVLSTPPIPQFTMESSKQRRLPSQFILDASPSYDVDTINDNDALSYDWAFSNNDNVSIDKTYDEGKRIVVSFREKGSYKITLTVKDSYGKIEQTSKDIVIESSLRPYIFANPISTQLSSSTNFVTKANKLIASYKWDFGDGTVNTIQTDKITHSYKKVGTYRVKLTATTPEGEENDVYTNVFIGEANSPIPAYTVQNDKSDSMIPEGICTDTNGDKSLAYLVERYQDITINGSDSVNIQGSKENLAYYFKPQLGDTSKRQQMRYKFDEVGCQFMDFRVEDVAASKSANTRIWFFVTNAKPKIENIIMSFPQVGNTYGVGIGQNTNKDLFKTDTIDPLVVKIDAMNVVDKDGSISKYKWYYYNIDDPDRLLEIKYTPGNSPFVYFSIPRIAGEFRFGVEVYDNDGASTKSEDLLGKGPVVFFPPDSKNPDIPIVTLKTDRGNAKVGEEVNLEAVAKITSTRNDFTTNRTFSYDFDGDGVWDLVTKDDKVTYIYKNPGNYTPRVKVTYRSRSGIANGDTIAVEKGIKAGFLYGVVGSTLIVRDTSYGDIDSRKFCADIRQCKTNPAWFIENQSYFSKTYSIPGKYIVRYDVQDKNGNSSSAGNVIVNIGEAQPKDSIGILTLPAPDKNGNVSIGKALDNKVLFYVGYNGGGDCYIDTDITRSNNNTQRTDQDRDITCGVETIFPYKPSVGSTIARVYYNVGNNIVTKDIPIQFLDYDIELGTDQKVLYSSIDGILNQLGDTEPDLKSALLILRNTIAEGDDTSSLVLQIKDIVENKGSEITATIQKQIADVLAKLENETTCSAEGCNTYKLSRTTIINLFPTNRKNEIAKLFEDIDSAAGDKTRIKQDLDKILVIGNEEYQKKVLDDTDIQGLQKEICDIIGFYDITGTSCKLPNSADYTGSTINGPTVETTGSTSIIRKILKVVGIIAGVLGLGFIILVIIFALKAKKKQEVPQG